MKGIPLKIIKYKSAEESQKSPVVSTTYSIFKNGEFITHSILTIDKFMKLLE
ncbi:YoaP domain-containing protein [Clostridium tetani]|uniref:YoaP domain-containing protein n=1 Tax=Clostridium tetani TaxID=1513 RepID=UPI0013E948E6|nr:YoaP domain-containing protein [Clostridium tetani]